MANDNRAVNNSSPPDLSNPKGIAGSELDPNVSLIPLEVIRTDEASMFGTGLSISQLISVAALVGAGILWAFVLRQAPATSRPAEA
jgi:hypothetical protein